MATVDGNQVEELLVLASTSAFPIYLQPGRSDGPTCLRSGVWLGSSSYMTALLFSTSWHDCPRYPYCIARRSGHDIYMTSSYEYTIP